MKQIKIYSYVDINNATQEQNLAAALDMVETNHKAVVSDYVDGVVTKLYYVNPKIDKILVVVNKEGTKDLNLESQILLDSTIAEFPLVKLPPQTVAYKEIIIKKGSSLSRDEMLNIAQSQSDALASEVMPYKLPIVKVIDYNEITDNSVLVLSSHFTSNPFLSSDGRIMVGGDAVVGGEVYAKLRVLEKLKKELASKESELERGSPLKGEFRQLHKDKIKAEVQWVSDYNSFNQATKERKEHDKLWGELNLASAEAGENGSRKKFQDEDKVIVAKIANFEGKYKQWESKYNHIVNRENSLKVSIYRWESNLTNEIQKLKTQIKARED